jgi:hypothetical protein
MTHVEGFDNLDEMFASMAAHEDEANRRLLPGQVRLRDDAENETFWAQPAPDIDLVIYGVAQPTFVVQRSADFDAADNRERGYLTGTAYSAATGAETGEYGDTHVSQVIPITRTVFRLAQTLGWPDWSRLVNDPECRTLGALLAKAEQDARA